MKNYRAKECSYIILRSNPLCSSEPIPLFRDPDGDKIMYCVGPNHGRSFVVGRTNDGKYIISKGNGLSYSQFQFLFTPENNENTWGLLLRDSAIRDFDLGMEIASLGIRTNKMEYVIELETKIQLTSGHIISPILLQYVVDCPYRICDTPYMPKYIIDEQVQKWEQLNERGFEDYYMIAANVLISNLRKLHLNNILHNAIHYQNYTWALELLDFEIACSPAHPYSKSVDMSIVKDLFSREVVQTYEIINHIAGCLGENIDYKKVDDLFAEYGFELLNFVEC